MGFSLVSFGIHPGNGADPEFSTSSGEKSGAEISPSWRTRGCGPFRPLRRRGARCQTRAMTWAPDPEAVRGRVAVVAGATRGAGRAIAAALGEAGATVVCTGRSSTTGTLRSDYDRPETIEETAALVDELGGVGVPIAVDHLDPAQVSALAARVREEHGHVDVLVNDIWGGEVLKGGPAQWNTPIWEHDLETGLRILRLAIDTHLIT